MLFGIGSYFAVAHKQYLGHHFLLSETFAVIIPIPTGKCKNKARH